MPAPTELDRRQYAVEKDLAARLRSSKREERTELFKVLYGELFERIPDHIRLTRRDTPEQSQRAVDSRLRLLRPALTPDTVMLEIAPGDCRLAAAAAALAKKVIAVDISDQHDPNEQLPANLELVIYDGYHLSVATSTVDVVFSYQFLEHLHPDDVDPHFEMVARVLKPGGCYIFDTPHRYSGPHDVSALFGHTLDCLHMQEWTYHDMITLCRKHGFTETYAFRRGEVRKSGFLNAMNLALESFCGVLPPSLRRAVCKKLFGSVTLMAVKG
ncbi:MAG: phenylalanyl-tRNA synthetase subunit alpha [Verrucomicrobiaceae bacterium]|nr:phenylalanyl-tRNA synthetase subunit alpha [Verrucomicrobiaceae bacterium]